MKKLLLLLMFATSAFAQQQEFQVFELTRPMKCAAVEDIMLFINQNFGETMAWVGKDENNSSYLALYKNKETGSWSLIQYDSKVGCFIGSGSQGSPV
jgi:hypothetical protein